MQHYEWKELLWVPVGAFHWWMMASMRKSTKSAPPLFVPSATESSVKICGSDCGTLIR